LTGPAAPTPNAAPSQADGGGNDRWPGGQDNETGKPNKGILNSIEAIKRSGIACTWDDFRQKEYWSGHADKSFDGEVKCRTETNDEGVSAFFCQCWPPRLQPKRNDLAGLRGSAIGSPRVHQLSALVEQVAVLSTVLKSTRVAKLL
jgi:hypothetical protein